MGGGAGPGLMGMPMGVVPDLKQIKLKKSGGAAGTPRSSPVVSQSPSQNSSQNSSQKNSPMFDKKPAVGRKPSLVVKKSLVSHCFSPPSRPDFQVGGIQFLGRF